MSFKRKELNRDGEPNQPIRIVDDHGNTLQDKDTEYKAPKIGNGSVVNVNFAVNEYKKGEFSMNILSLQVWDLVKFDAEFPTKPSDTEGDWASEVTEEAA